jgi:hypothetical protein
MKSAAALTLATTVASELMFGGYLEGVQQHKAVTLFNNGCSEIDLTDYRIQMTMNDRQRTSQKDGGTDHSHYIDFDAGSTLASGATFMVCNDKAHFKDMRFCKLEAGFTTGSIDHNGDDTLTLLKYGDPSATTTTTVFMVGHSHKGEDVPMVVVDSIGEEAYKKQGVVGEGLLINHQCERLNSSAWPKGYTCHSDRPSLLGTRLTGSDRSASAVPLSVPGKRLKACTTPSTKVAVEHTSRVETQMTVAGLTAAQFDASFQESCKKAVAAEFGVHESQVTVTIAVTADRRLGAAEDSITLDIEIAATADQIATVEYQITELASDGADGAAAQASFTGLINVYMEQAGETAVVTVQAFAPPVVSDGVHAYGEAYCARGYYEGPSTERIVHASVIVGEGSADLASTHDTCHKCPEGETSVGGHVRSCHAISATWATCSHLACKAVTTEHKCYSQSANPSQEIATIATTGCKYNSTSTTPAYATTRIAVFHHGQEEAGITHKCFLDGQKGAPFAERSCKCQCKDVESL